MHKRFGSDGLGSSNSLSLRTFKTARLSSILLIPCLTLSAITLHQSEGQAQSFLQRRIQQRMQEKAKLAESQKQQLFQVGTDWLLSSYGQRLALLQSIQACLKDARTFQDGQECRSKRRQAGRQLLEEGRQVINTERQRLDLSPLQSGLPFSL